MRTRVRARGSFLSSEAFARALEANPELRAATRSHCARATQAAYPGVDYSAVSDEEDPLWLDGKTRESTLDLVRTDVTAVTLDLVRTDVTAVTLDLSLCGYCTYTPSPRAL